ncbi:unnamed protein product, partial [Rotaria sordida]
LHALGDFDEYCIDSSAMACRSRATYLDYIRQHPLPKTIDPIIVKAIAIPTNIGNPCLSGLIFVISPTIKKTIPTTMIKP